MSLYKNEAAEVVLVTDKYGKVVGVNRNGKTTYLPVVVGRGTQAVALTGTTANTELARCVIPGGCLGPNGYLQFNCLFSMTGSTNAKSFSALISNQIDFLSGQTITDVNVVGLSRSRVMWNRGTQNSQIIVASWGADSLVFSQPDTGNADMSIDQPMIISAQLANASETITLQAWTLTAFPSD